METRPTPTIIPSPSSNREWNTGIDTFNMTREELFEFFERHKAKHPPKRPHRGVGVCLVLTCR